MLPRSSKSKPVPAPDSCGYGETRLPRAVSVIWVNRRTTSDVRTTMHSFLSQAESTGEIIGGFALAALAQAGGITVTLLTSAAFIAATGALVAASRGGAPPG
jgi:hypothetical protein